MKKILLFLEDGQMVNLAHACTTNNPGINLDTVVFDNNQVVNVKDYDLIVISNYLDPKKINNKYFFGHDALLEVLKQGYEKSIVIALVELKYDVKMYLSLNNQEDKVILTDYIDVAFFESNQLTANTYFVREHLFLPAVMFFPC